MKKTNRLYVLVGLPASGKSTACEMIMDEMTTRKVKCEVVCPDDIRKELTGSVEDQTQNAKVFSVAHTRTKNLLKAGKSVIFDATSVNKKDRRALIKMADSAKAGKIAVWMDTGMVESKKRNNNRDRVVPDFVYERMNRKFQQPTTMEGFDSVIRVGMKTDITKII